MPQTKDGASRLYLTKSPTSTDNPPDPANVDEMALALKKWDRVEPVNFERAGWGVSVAWVHELDIQNYTTLTLVSLYHITDFH